MCCTLLMYFQCCCERQISCSISCLLGLPGDSRCEWVSWLQQSVSESVSESVLYAEGERGVCGGEWGLFVCCSIWLKKISFPFPCRHSIVSDLEGGLGGRTFSS